METIDVSAVDDVPAAVRELTAGRGPDAVIDAVGMEAHGAPVGKLAHTIAGLHAGHRRPQGDGDTPASIASAR